MKITRDSYYSYRYVTKSIIREVNTRLLEDRYFMSRYLLLYLPSILWCNLSTLTDQVVATGGLLSVHQGILLHLWQGSQGSTADSGLLHSHAAAF